MKNSRKTFIKFVTYLAFFVFVGLSLGAAASEFTVVDALNAPLLNKGNTEAEVIYHPFWLLISVLIGYIAMTQRKGI